MSYFKAKMHQIRGEGRGKDGRRGEGTCRTNVKLGPMQARRQEMKWGVFVKKWTFPHKMKRN